MSASPERGSGAGAEKGRANPRVGFPSLDISVGVSSVGIGAGTSAGVSSVGVSSAGTSVGFPSAGFPGAGFPSAGTSASVPNDGTSSQQEEFNKLLAGYKKQIADLINQVRVSGSKINDLHRKLGHHELELRNAQGLNEFLRARLAKVLNEARIQSQEKTAEIYKLKLDIEALKARIIQLLRANQFLKYKDGSGGFGHDEPIPGLGDSLEKFGISVDPSRPVDGGFDTQTGPEDSDAPEDSEFPGVPKTPADTVVPRGFTPSAGDTGGGGASGVVWHSAGRPSGGADRPSGASGAAWHSAGRPSGVADRPSGASGAAWHSAGRPSGGADRPSGSGAAWHIGGGASGGASGAGRPSGASGVSGASGAGASASDSRYVKETLEPCFMIPYGITRSEINSLNEAEKRFTSRSRTQLINKLHSLTSSHSCTETIKGLKCRIPTCYECSRINRMLNNAIRDANTSLIAICKYFGRGTYSPNPIRPGSTFKTDYYYYTTLIRMYQRELDDFMRGSR
jgi:hypothetical protein